MRASIHMVNASRANPTFTAYVSQGAENLPPSVDHQRPCGFDREKANQYPHLLGKVRHGGSDNTLQPCFRFSGAYPSSTGAKPGSPGARTGSPFLAATSLKSVASPQPMRKEHSNAH